jgi:hypothetical protein
MARSVNASGTVDTTRTPTRPTIRRTKDGQPIYEPDGFQLARFLLDDSRVAVIRGPVGSGKSVASMQRLWRHCCQQVPNPATKRRHVRIAVVRNTYPDLEQSTVRTWLDLFPEEAYGRFLWSKPMCHHIRVFDLDVEVVFIALDKKEDVRKLRSTEWTIIYFNELQYIPKELFDEATTRVGRYPSMKDGGPTWYGVIADMNAPEEDHWLPLMLGEVDFPESWSQADRELYRWPAEWAYFCQPAGLTEVFGPDGKTVVGYEMNPEAENTRWLVQPYTEQAQGKTKSFIDSRLMNRITLVADGDPVWAQFRAETHVAGGDLAYIPGHVVYVGLDFGRRPSAVFGQCINGRWIIIHEIQRFDMGASLFAPLVKREMIQRFPPDAVFKVFGDPKGRDKTQTFEATAYDIFATNGIDVLPAPVKGNDIKTRIEAVSFVLQGMQDGLPRFQLSPACRSLKVAMAGKYCWSKAKGETEPKKDKYSDLADALQYLIIGGGEGRAMVGRTIGGSIGTVAKVTRVRGAQRRVR